jgi:hypothetical protein
MLVSCGETEQPPYRCDSSRRLTEFIINQARGGVTTDSGWLSNRGRPETNSGRIAGSYSETELVSICAEMQPTGKIVCRPVVVG